MYKATRKKNTPYQPGRVVQMKESEGNVRVFKPNMDKLIELMPVQSLTNPDPGKVAPISSVMGPAIGSISTIQRIPPAQESMRVSKSFERKTNFFGNQLDQRIVMMNKACYVFPDHQDFGTLTNNSGSPGVSIDGVNEGLTKYQNLLLEQYGFDLVVSEDVEGLKKALGATVSPKKENSSQYANPDQTFVDTDGSPWQNVDNVEDIEQLLKKGGKPYKNYTPKNVRIGETPRVKVVAEKYSKIKKNNIELRKLEEKIVCVEYDVYDKDLGFFTKPVQVMRAFFSIKTGCELCNGEKILSAVPSALRNRLQIEEGNVKLMTEKEVEIIDEKIRENRPYLDDLKRVLNKKRVINDMKKKSRLDLACMYEMAKRDNAPLDHDFSNTNLLSLAELQEIKDLISKKCDGGGYGISRRTMTADANLNGDSVFYQLLGNMRLSSRRT